MNNVPTSVLTSCFHTDLLKRCNAQLSVHTAFFGKATTIEQPSLLRVHLLALLLETRGPLVMNKHGDCCVKFPLKTIPPSSALCYCNETRFETFVMKTRALRGHPIVHCCFLMAVRMAASVYAQVRHVTKYRFSLLA